MKSLVSAGTLKMFVAVVLFLVFACTVWPTPYQYYRVRYWGSGGGVETVVRENRFTHRLEWLDPERGIWVPQLLL